MSDRRGGAVALLVLVLVAAACFARLVAQPSALLVDGARASIDLALPGAERGIGNDLTRLFLPRQIRLSDTIGRLRRLPYWDPWGFGGRPLVGNPQAGLWYPPVWLAWLSQSPAALGWLTVAHLVWGGLGVYVLVRMLGLGLLPAIVAGGCFEASPYLLAQAFEGHIPHVWAASWYPWAFAAALVMRRGNWRGAIGLALVLALSLLAGHPQEWLYLMLALSCWALGDAYFALRRGLLRSGDPAMPPSAAGVSSAGWSVARWGCALALALGLAAVELGPDIATRAWTSRAANSLEPVRHTEHYRLLPLNLVQLLSPWALGGPADYFGHDNHWETVLAFGWVCAVLAVEALAASPRRVLVRSWAGLVIAAIVFAAGRRLGLFALVAALAPGFDQVRVPARSLFLATLGMSVLAGIGLEAIGDAARGDPQAWRARWRRSKRSLAVVVAGLLAGQCVAWSIGTDAHAALAKSANKSSSASTATATLADPASRANDARGKRSREGDGKRLVLACAEVTHDAVFLAALASTALVLFWLRKRPGDSKKAALALGALALAELAAQGFQLLVTSPAERFLGTDPVARAIERAAPAGPFRIRARDLFFDDLRATSAGLEKTNANDFFQLGHAADVYEALYPLFERWPTMITGPVDLLHRQSNALVQGVLDRMNVSLLVTDRPDTQMTWPVAASGQANGRTYIVYRNPGALPRAYVVPRALTAPDDDSAVSLFGFVDPHEAVLMKNDPLTTTETRRQPFTPATYEANDPDHVAVQVTTEAPGLLVVADTWMPGWSARVDGKPAPLLVGNHAQRVVPLPHAGPHRVEMRYRPPGLDAGLAITGASMLVCACGLLRLSRPRAAEGA